MPTPVEGELVLVEVINPAVEDVTFPYGKNGLNWVKCFSGPFTVCEQFNVSIKKKVRRLVF